MGGGLDRTGKELKGPKCPKDQGTKGPRIPKGPRVPEVMDETSAALPPTETVATAPSPFARIKARSLILWLGVAVVLCVVGLSIAWPWVLASSDEPDPWPDAVLTFLQSGLLVIVGVLHARGAGLRIGDLFRYSPSGRETLSLAALALPLIGVALVGSYVLYAPLSLAFPDAIHYWLFEDLPVFYSATEPIPVAGNIAGIVAMSVAAPVAEEWFFRGLLLPRWSYKWGPVGGVIGSSLLFALGHAEILGGFVFAVAMCAVYARYQTLWAPIIVHVTNNAFVAGLTILSAHGTDVGEFFTVAEMRAAWWWPAIGLVVALAGIPYVRRTWVPMSTWTFAPDLSSTTPPTPS